MSIRVTQNSVFNAENFNKAAKVITAVGVAATLALAAAATAVALTIIFAPAAIPALTALGSLAFVVLFAPAVGTFIGTAIGATIAKIAAKIAPPLKQDDDNADAAIITTSNKSMSTLVPEKTAANQPSNLTITLNDNLKEELTSRVAAMEKQKPKMEVWSDRFTPFQEIPLRNGLSIWLANDTLRESLSNGRTNVGRTNVLEAANQTAEDQEIMVSNFGEGNVTFPRMNRAPKLLVTVNGDVTTNGIEKHPQINIDGLDHFQLPISEDDEAYEAIFSDGRMTELFLKMDQTLNNDGDILIHCNQGEHRSAAILTLYIATRTGKSFESAWLYVQAHRTHIKPYDKGRTTLMTTAYSKYTDGLYPTR